MSDLSELLTVPEAAKLAGVSERTMRRWATTGHVRTVGRGHRRRVVAASLSEPAATVGRDGHEKRSTDSTVSAMPVIESATAAEANRLADLVRELTGRVSELAATAAMWQARAGMLEERVRALEAPKPEPAPETSTTVDTPPWWCRRWPSLAGAGVALAVLAVLAVAAGTALGWVRIAGV